MRVACGSSFEHAISASCPTDARGRCEHLTRAGWRAVRARVELDTPGAHKVTVFTQGGWLCPGCVTAYVPPLQRKLW